jgi:hypothetical protein
MPFTRSVHTLKHYHELAPMQDWDLWVCVLKVQLNEARTKLPVWEGRLPYGGFGLESKEGVAH